MKKRETAGGEHGETMNDRDGQNCWGYELQGKGGNYEDADNGSDIGFAADGVRPDNGAATIAGADERNADDCAGEREEGASRARAE